MNVKIPITNRLFPSIKRGNTTCRRIMNKHFIIKIKSTAQNVRYLLNLHRKSLLSLRGVNVGVESISIHSLHFDLGFKERVYSIIFDSERINSSTRGTFHTSKSQRQSNREGERRSRSFFFFFTPAWNASTLPYDQKSFKTVEHDR